MNGMRRYSWSVPETPNAHLVGVNSVVDGYVSRIGEVECKGYHGRRTLYADVAPSPVDEI